jgi:hypothetical protein
MAAKLAQACPSNGGRVRHSERIGRRCAIAAAGRTMRSSALSGWSGVGRRLRALCIALCAPTRAASGQRWDWSADPSDSDGPWSCTGSNRRNVPRPGDRLEEVAPSALPFDLDQSFYWHCRHHAPYAENPGSRPMPTDIIVVALIAAAFGIFAATLYWADLRTRGVSK